MPTIGQVSAPAKSFTNSNNARTQNKFENLKEEEQKKEEPVQSKTESKGPPKFIGSLKGMMSKQNEVNAESNKNLPEL